MHMHTLGVKDYQKEWSDERGPDFGNFLKPSAGENMVFGLLGHTLTIIDPCSTTPN